MRILVAGAYGLVGGYVVSRLVADGHEVIGAGRDVDAARRRFPSARWIEVDLRYAEAAQWVQALDGVEAVINCAGALQDSPRDDLVAAHVEGLARLLAACEQAGVRRFVQISAAGVGPDRCSAFNDAKQAAEERLRASCLDWSILRPGLVLAPAAYGGTALLRGLAGFPLVTPCAWADSTMQVVSAEDVAAAVAAALEPSAPMPVSLDLCHDEQIPMDRLLGDLRAWLGLPPARVWRAPGWLAAGAGRVADGLAWLGWRSPMRTQALTQLRLGVHGDGGAAVALLGHPPLSLRQMLDRWPSGVQERWFARAYFAKPVILAVLAAFWLVSGLVGLTAGREAAIEVLAKAGVSTWLSPLAVVGGSLVDIALGLAVCARPTARAALLGMLVVTLAYLTGGAWLRPDLWLDPLGPLVKSVPAAALALVALALMDER